MNKFLLVLMTCFLFLSACNAQNKGQKFEWKQFVSDEGKFKVMFPANPEQSSKENDGKLGKRRSYNFEVSSNETAFAVVYQDLPNLPTLDKDSLKLLHDNLRDQALKNTNSKLLTERDVWLDENLGRELVVKIDDQILTNRTYFVGNRQFQVSTSVNSSISSNKEIISAVKTFLDSFQLTDK